MNKKTVIAPALALAIAGIVMYGTATALAQDSVGEYPVVVQRIAERFGLSQDEVNGVFDEVHDERMAEMHARFEDKLSQAVTDGKITEEQKQAILNKTADLQAEREANRASWQNIGREERREAMQLRETEIQSWAETNGIDMSVLGGGMGFGGHRGMMGGMWKN